MKIGDTVSFKYNGGSNYGSMRRLKITEETAKSWAGIDLDTNDYRKFLKARMVGAKVVIENAFEEDRLELEKFLNKQKYSAYLASNLVEQFNKKHKVDYQYVSNKVVEKPRLVSSNVIFRKTKNLKTNKIELAISKDVNLMVDENGYVYVNHYYINRSPDTYKLLNNF